MKKLLLTILFLLTSWLIPSSASAQCNGVFPSLTVCGSVAGGPPVAVPYTNFGFVIGPNPSTIGCAAPWANITGTLLANNCALSISGTTVTFANPVNLSGASSGAVTLAAQSVAGTPTVTFGTSSGTPAVTASSPLVLATATGNIACPTCLTANQTITLSGDTTGSGTTAITTTTVKVNGVAYGTSPGTNTVPVVTGANTVTYEIVPVAAGGTNCSAASITCFNNITGFSAAGTTGTTSSNLVFSTSPTLSGTINVSGTFQAGGNTQTFPGSAATLAALNLADQTLSGGANVTSSNQGTKSSGTFTVDCGASPLQYFTDGGAFTLAAPSNDGNCILRMLNNASAGAVTFSGFTVGANTGDALNTTNTNAFAIQIWRINGVSRYLVSAYQ